MRGITEAREIARFTDRKTTVVGGLRGRRERLYASPTGFFTITNDDTVHSGDVARKVLADSFIASGRPVCAPCS